MSDALLDIALGLLDCGVRQCRGDGRYWAQDFQDVVNTLSERFYIIR